MRKSAVKHGGAAGTNLALVIQGTGTDRTPLGISVPP